jgi:hypothetical protein
MNDAPFRSLIDGGYQRPNAFGIGFLARQRGFLQTPQPAQRAPIQE